MSTLITNPGDTTLLRAITAEAYLVEAICFVLFQAEYLEKSFYFILLALTFSKFLRRIWFSQYYFN